MPTLDEARAWYADADAVHDFAHIERVYANARRIAEAEGADWSIVEAAALLHDADELMGADADARIAHHHRAAQAATDLLAKEGWPEAHIEAVAHCIRAHRFRGDEAPQTIEAQVLFDADKLDAIGAVGAARAVSFATLQGNPVYQKPSASFLADFTLAEGETYTAYHEYVFKLSRIPERLYTAAGRALAAERMAVMHAFFEQLAIEMDGTD